MATRDLRVEALALQVQGLTNGAIAKRIGRSTKQVGRYLKSTVDHVEDVQVADVVDLDDVAAVREDIRALRATGDPGDRRDAARLQLSLMQHTGGSEADEKRANFAIDERLRICTNLQSLFGGLRVPMDEGDASYEEYVLTAAEGAYEAIKAKYPQHAAHMEERVAVARRNYENYLKLLAHGNGPRWKAPDDVA